ncbi:Fis family transcriptional regulator [Marinomonas gallaica]|uniref:Fis family transcriptional regulator n=1 Tax=Marinomonas gallaica TaxID=1806667 RepID=UPI003A8EB88A
MRKTDKKIENNIRDSLTEVCDELLELKMGFEWITHLIDFKRFPQSLKIVCIFNDDETEQAFLNSPHFNDLKHDLLIRFKAMDISLKDIDQHLFLDNEAACLRTHEGKWGDRLRAQ